MQRGRKATSKKSTVMHNPQTDQTYQILETLASNKNRRVLKVGAQDGTIWAAKTLDCQLAGCFPLQREYKQYLQLAPHMGDRIPQLPSNPYFLAGNTEVLLMEFIPRTLGCYLDSEKVEESVRSKAEEQLQPEELLDLAYNMLATVWYFQAGSGLVHTDLKPINFLLREPNRTYPVLIDFGSAVEVGHTPFAWTTVWASLPSLAMKPASFLDDLEAVGYILAAFFLKWEGRALPWLELKTKAAIIREKKRFLGSLGSIAGSDLMRRLVVYFDLVLKTPRDALRTAEDLDEFYPRLIAPFQPAYEGE